MNETRMCIKKYAFTRREVYIIPRKINDEGFYLVYFM